MTYQGSDSIFNALCDVVQSVAGLEDLFLGPLANLAMSTCCLAVVLEKGIVEGRLALLIADFLAGGSLCIFIVQENFTFGIVPCGVKVREEHARRRRLRQGSGWDILLSLLLGPLAFLFLFWKKGF
jgi:hypothetical protein